MSIGSVTSEGAALIERWTAAIVRKKRAASELSHAECEFSNANSALAKWLKPNDAKPEETYCIWHEDSMLSVKGDSETVTIRHRGKRSSL